MLRRFKYLKHFCARAEHKGRTVHLLKKSSKSVPELRKRRKIELKGTFQEFQAGQEEIKREEPASSIVDPNQQAAAQNAANIAAGANIFNPGGPNVIANVEDMSNVQFGAAEETPVLGGMD